MTPHEALTDAIRDLGEDGKRPPCTTDPERWTGDDHGTYLAAAAICLTCPLITPCRAVGVLETHGVWGGLIRTKTRRKGAADEPTLFDLQETA